MGEDFDFSVPSKYPMDVSAMEELLGKEFGSETPPVAITPSGSRITPCCASRRMSAFELGKLQEVLGADQIKEKVVSDLMGHLLKMLDERGLIDLEISQVNPGMVEFRITLEVIDKNEHH